ncbi:MAG: transporter [Flavobacteriaceae bacterium]|nr:transporter [Flavobacteriaceae bacterium]
MKKHYPFTLAILTLGGISNTLFGQTLPSIQLDRPDQTECPFITPTRYIQIENGILNEKQNSSTMVSAQSSLWKYGINEKLELRIITEFTTANRNFEGKIAMSPITIGFKTALLEEKGFRPKTSFIGHISSSKLGSSSLETPYIAPSFRFTMQHTLTKNISLAYNLGAEWDGKNAGQTYIYTLTTGIGLSPKISFYSELYGFLAADQLPDHRLDGGFTYLVNQNLMTDISGGIGLTENAAQHYIAIGLSYRFNTQSP